MYIGNIPLTRSAREICFVCPFLASTPDHGIVVVLSSPISNCIIMIIYKSFWNCFSCWLLQKIPRAFVVNYLQYIPSTVGLHLPIGKALLARFVECTQSFEGLEQIIQLFHLTHNHLIAFRYHGGSEFGMEIFNPSGVQIDYCHRGTKMNYVMWFQLWRINSKLWSMIVRVFHFIPCYLILFIGYRNADFWMKWFVTVSTETLLSGRLVWFIMYATNNICC